MSAPEWVTEAAIEKLCHVQEQVAAQPRSLRLFLDAGGGFGFMRDTTRPGDRCLELAFGELLIDPQSARRLAGRRLHYRVVEDEGGRFEIETIGSGEALAQDPDRR